MSSNPPDSRVKPRALLPASHAFVVQFDRDTDPWANRFVGQVEHLASARQKRFASRDEMLVFIDETLVESAACHEEAKTGQDEKASAPQRGIERDR